MKNFIEVTYNDQKISINVNHISTIQFFESGKAAEVDKSCEIIVSDLHDGSSAHYHVDESYEEVKQLIESSI